MVKDFIDDKLLLLAGNNYIYGKLLFLMTNDYYER